MLRDIIPVVEPFLDDDAHQAKCQSRVRARLNGNVPVSGLGRACAIGIDDHQPRAVAPCFFDEGPQVNVIAVDIRRPRDDVFCVAEVFRVRAQLFPVHRDDGIGACSRAYSAIQARGAKPVEEASIHGAITEHGHVPGIGVGKDGLRTVFLCDAPQSFRDQVQCLIPADGFEDVSLAAVRHFPFCRSGPAPHGVEQPRRRVDPIQIFGHLGTKKAASDRMRGVALHARGLTLFIDGYQNSARIRAIV